jgi:ankyrin repeat protein
MNYKSELPGFTAFHLACYKADPDIVEALVRAGCDTSAIDADGKTGQQIAKLGKHAAVLERLAALEREDKRRAKMNQDIVAAAHAGAAETLTGMLDAGGDPNASVPPVRLQLYTLRPAMATWRQHGCCLAAVRIQIWEIDEVSAQS